MSRRVVGLLRERVMGHLSGPGYRAGQGFVEFGVILALAALVAVAVLVLFRSQLAFVLSMIGSEVDKSGWLAAGLSFA